MNTKIIFLWIFITIGFILHHIYGLFGVYYNESIMIEGATGDVPMIHHMYRILFEGVALLLGVLTVEISNKGFKWGSFVWASLLGLFNVYHLITAIIYEATNISEIFALAIMVLASFFLVKNLNEWRKA